MTLNMYVRVPIRHPSIQFLSIPQSVITSFYTQSKLPNCRLDAHRKACIFYLIDIALNTVLCIPYCL